MSDFRNSLDSAQEAAVFAGQILRLLQEEFMVRFPAFPEVFGQLTPVFLDRAETSQPEPVSDAHTPFPGSWMDAALGTDGIHLYCSPSLLCAEFLQSPDRTKHAYLHVHIHCLCLHMCPANVNSLLFTRENSGVKPHSGRRKTLWDQACDLSAELMAGLLLGEDPHHLKEQLAALHFTDAYMDAAALLPLLQASPALRSLAAQCSRDTHRFWYEDTPDADSRSLEQARALSEGTSGRDPSSFLRLQETLAARWQKQRCRLNTFLSDKAGQRNQDAGQGSEDAALQKRDETDYRKFLHQFAVPREELLLDTDSFDYIPYCYGLTYYKNMPFLEPLEYCEVNRLDELAIAVDTSGSCSGQIVRRFLEETWNILRQKENFFSRMRLHLIQCDSMIQDHQIFTSVEQWEEALPNLKIQGMGNTDFRPVFDYLNTLIRKKEIRYLRGLLYFTDGDGIYPRTRPPFDTAFVFLNRKLEKQKIPDWGIRLNLDLPDLQ